MMQSGGRRASESFRPDWPETLWMDSIPESPGAHQFAEDPATTADGVGGGDRLATMAGDLMETPGEMTRANESSEAGAGAVDVVPESRVHMPVALEEQVACPEMPRGMVGRFVWPPSP